MFRRKTRNSTAYTGVGNAPLVAQQPNTNAMAAALTIGENLKQSNPNVYGKPRAPSLSRSQPQTRSLGSLLKRSSSIQGPQIRATSTPKTSRTSSESSTTHPHVGGPQNTSRVEYSVDDSFNDSTLEQIGHEADAHYSNRANMSDLKLHHTPATQQQVKMVKRYIPTPNGIKVVEVPESTMKQEIARSNSLRSGSGFNRSPLFSRTKRVSSMNGSLQGNRPPQANLSRRLSILGTPKLGPPKIDENVELERRAATESAAAEKKSESENLKRQIAEEERLAKELEAQRLEFERLKELRLSNERKLRELKRLEEEEEALSRTVSPASETRYAPLAEVHAPEKSTVAEAYPAEQISAPIDKHIETEDDEEAAANVSHIVVDEFEQKEVEEADDSDEEDVPITQPIPFAVDELAKRRLEDDIPSSEYSLDVPSIISPPLDEPIVADSDAHHTFHDLDEFGIEEVPNEEYDTPNLALHLRPQFDSQRTESLSPKFDPVPEIIDDAHDSDELSPPSLNLAAGSIRSIGSMDSKSSKPIKSAMKMPKASYLSKSSSADSPAHQAYLSLTTAENTRLNSKLSASQLNDIGVFTNEQRPSPPKSPVTPLKRMSQSLRKQPSNQATGGMAGRSLRPRSQSDASQTGRTNGPTGGGMSSRTFKSQPQPIPPHPALQPNYQSPSKLRAAELYAKANNRPRSQFQPIQRLSSFTKNHEHGKPEGAGAPTPKPELQGNHRLTLRGPRPQSHVPQSAYQESQAPAPSHANNGVTGGGFKGFRSKFADSDDEDAPAYTSSGGGFHSRFNDSNDDLPGAGKQAASKISAPPPPREEVRTTPIVTLRNQKGPKETPKEEKPKKKKFLRKLFGRS